MTRTVFFFAVALLLTALTVANATVAVNGLFSTNMVLQRDRPIPVWGTATANKTITVVYNGQTKTTTSDAQGNWMLNLDAIAAKTTGSNMTISEASANTLTFTNVVVGDVWVCSGQSNMAFGLSGCNRQVDIDSANYPGIRHFWVPLVTADNPLRTVTGSWTVCSPSTAAVFPRLFTSRERSTPTRRDYSHRFDSIDSGRNPYHPWLAQDGCTDVPVLAPLFSQSVLPWGPFSLANGMIHPLAPYGIKGAIWYQGENSESTVQSADSYFLKMKALAQGWKRLFGLDDFAFYFVQIANWNSQPTDATPVLTYGGWDPDTRLQEVNSLAIPHSGMGSALDIGDSGDMHPKDKLDLGERLALSASEE